MAQDQAPPMQSSETLADQVVTPGIILFTERFEQCVRFYRDMLGLPVWFEKEGLCCLRFGSGYLMVETGGHASAEKKTVHENPTALRFNVRDVEAAAQLLRQHGIAVSVAHHDWGVTGRFLDPDGNICSLKDADDPFFAEL
ncbi:glyoxalase [Thioclava dalianensis]|uniref:Glyoxalase n=2 Tax=Thioclava dalianensis TaxID=1185766 RepID=A0A074TEG2_9RHOB|nr:glyoxalase [Thioclava dalianensis]